MGLIVDNIFWILMVTGVLTTLVALGALAPGRAVAQAYGSELADPGLTLVVRHWHFLIGVSGILLIVAALHPEWRVPLMWTAIASKSAFAALVLGQFRAFAGKPVITGAIADIVMVVLYLLYLVAA